MISFEYPYILIFGIIIWSIWIVFFREKFWYILPNPSLQKYLRVPMFMYIIWVLRFFLVMILFGVLAWPYSEGLKKIQKVPEKKIVIILDISRSMLEEDIEPDRLTEAKNTIHTFLTYQKNADIALVFFAGKAFVWSHFTKDFAGIDNMVKNLNPYTIRQNLPGLSGTALWDALLLAKSLFGSGESMNHSIILFTDGQANIGIDPRLTLPELKSKKIQVFTLWIGKPGQGSIQTSSSGWEEWSSLDETLLKNLADSTGGFYMNARSTQDFSMINESLATSLNREQEEITRVKQDLSLYFILWLVIFLIWEGICRMIFWKKFKVL